MHRALQLIPGGGKPRAGRPAGAGPAGGGPALTRLLGSRPRLAALLGFVFLLNLVETNAETWLRATAWGEWSARVGSYLSQASGRWEWGLSFAQHDLAGGTLSHGYSIAYFAVFPLLCLGVAAALWRRRRLAPFRTYSLALTFDYALSLPFFLFFPVIERWAYSKSGAMLLSDKVSTSLIDWIRPMSGLDNCFPSFHVSMTAITILVAYRFRLRLRHSILCLGLTVVLSTLALGIHWQADVVAGTAVALLSVGGALRAERKLAAGEEDALDRVLPAPPPLVSILGGRAKRIRPLKPVDLPAAVEAPASAGSDAASAADGPPTGTSDSGSSRRQLIFVSYRRDDTAYLTDDLCKRLSERFDECVVFKDIDNIPPGANFKQYITNQLHQCDVFVAVIGKHWLGRLEGRTDSRLHDPRDLVRLELEVALEREIPLIPVLAHGASMPSEKELPPELANLTYQNALHVRRMPEFDADVAKLEKAIEYFLSGHKASGKTGEHVLPAAHRFRRTATSEERRERELSESRG